MTHQELMAELEKEKEQLPSEGSVIAHCVDHYHLTLDEILDFAKETELSPLGVGEFLMECEVKFGSVDKAVEHLRGYTKEVAQVTKEQRYAQYMSGSNEGMFHELTKDIEESKTRKSIVTGFPRLDEILSGGLHEGLYVVGAIPSLGKTTWVTQIYDRVAKYGTDVLMFSLEMSRIDLMARSISRLTVYKYPQIDGHMQTDAKTARGILDGKRYENYTERDRKIIAFAENEYLLWAKRIRVIEGTGDVSASEIRKNVEQHIEITERVPLVVVDYLQLIAPYDPRASDKQNMDRTVLELRRIARDYHCPVIVISSFNRQNYNAKVSFGSFKESGAIEYCADVMIGLQLEGVGEDGFDVERAKQSRPRCVEAVILKNRFGEVGEKIKYHYFANVNYFKELPKETFN